METSASFEARSAPLPYPTGRREDVHKATITSRRASELQVVGQMLDAGLDCYMTLVDDQAIDAVLRVPAGARGARYYDVQIKSGRTWSAIRGRVSSLGARANAILVLHNLSFWLEADAVAAVAGGVVVDALAPGRPVPVMHIHSVDDPRALYYGGLGPPFLFTSNRVNHPAVEDTLGRWISFDRCPTQVAVSPTLRGRSASSDEGNTSTKDAYGPCAGGTEVVLWKLTGSGHVWPGGVRDQYKRLLGKSTHVIDANEEMWQFFARFSLP
jgi:hypothetical protein